MNPAVGFPRSSERPSSGLPAVLSAKARMAAFPRLGRERTPQEGAGRRNRCAGNKYIYIYIFKETKTRKQKGEKNERRMMRVSYNIVPSL